MENLARFLHKKKKKRKAMDEKDIKVEDVNVNEEEQNVEQNVEQEAEQAEVKVEEDAKSETTEKAEQTGNDDALAKANAQIEELKDKYLRQVAEFDNFKKRTMREKADLREYGSQDALKAILPVLDDMERAIANADKIESRDELEEGWELIFKKFLKVLGDLGVKKIEALGKDFDVEYHEGVAMVPGVEDDKKGKVIDCIQTGYTLKDKVLRHAKVAIGQ